MHSMTGFGRASGTIGGSQLTVEVKTVNHRYLDSRFRLPSFLSILEIRWSELLRKHFHRGSFDINIRHKWSESGKALIGTKYVLDKEAASSFLQACEQLDDLNHKYSPTEKSPTIEAMAQAGRIFVAVEQVENIESQFPQMDKIFLEAISHVKKARNSEGERLKKVLSDAVGELSDIGEKVNKFAPGQAVKIQDDLKKRIAKLELSTQIDTQRLETEIAFYADRYDFTEELDRLSSHIVEFKELLNTDGPTGRKLDFYTQELHRELNTMGSKTNLSEVTKLVVQSKSTIEKLRQQVQNVE